MGEKSFHKFLHPLLFRRLITTGRKPLSSRKSEVGVPFLNSLTLRHKDSLIHGLTDSTKRKEGLHVETLLCLRSLPDLNRSSRFCRPVPSPSAKRPLSAIKASAKVQTFSQPAKLFCKKKRNCMILNGDYFPLTPLGCGKTGLF